MNTHKTWRVISMTTAAALLFVVQAAVADLAVRVSVQEPIGVARLSDPASGGVPFLPGQVRDVAELALFNEAGAPVPAQFSKLAGYEDGSVQWALVDLPVDLPANGKALFTVRAGKTVAPALPLQIEEDAERVTVATGGAAFTVNKVKFNVLESVAVAGRAVTGPGEATLTDAEGKVYRAGRPTSVKWEYRGPVRATLRVEGAFLNERDEEYVSYTTRLTFWAGSRTVRVSQSLRNSHPTDGFDARIKSAAVSLKLAGAGQATVSENDYLLVGDGATGLLVSDRHTAGCFPAGPPGTASESAKAKFANLHQLAAMEGRVVVHVVPEATEQNAGLIGYGISAQPPMGPDPRDASRQKALPLKRPLVAVGPHAATPGLPHFGLSDLAHKDSDIWFDFAFAGGAAGAKARRDALHTPLHVLADGAWVSQTGALGDGRFGTLDDEAATYRAWSWRGVDDQAKRAAARSPAIMDAFVSKVDIHDESESDSVQLFGLMYLRTGERGFLDQAAAYAGYYKGHGVWRTDGFVYDGFRHERSGVNAASKRRSTGLGHGWYGPREYGWSDGRFHMCHQWATGLIDFYCLTGDTDALEAGLDWAEYAAATHADQQPGRDHYWGRAWGRSFGIIVRAWQVTREEKWKTLADRYAQTAIKAPNRLPSGLFPNYYSSMVPYFVRDTLESTKNPMPPRLKALVEERGIVWKVVRGKLTFTDKTGKSWDMANTAQGFEYAACAEALARYAELTGDAEARRLVVDMARCARDFFWSHHCNFAISHPYIGFPEEGKVFDPGFWSDDHKECATGRGGVHSGYHSRFLTDIYARAYSASGDGEWLELARKVWNRGSKRGYQATAQACPDDTLMQFVGHDAPKGAHVDIRNCMRLFYEVPRAGR